MSVIILPLIISDYITFNRFAQEQESVYVANNTALLDEVNSRLDDYFTNLSNSTVSLYNERDLFVFSNEEAINWNEYSLYDRRNTILKNLLHQDTEISTLLFYYPITKELFIRSRHNEFSTNYFTGASVIEENPWYKDLIGSSKEFVIEPLHMLSGYLEKYRLNNGEQVISVYRLYRQGLFTKTIGVIAMNINPLFVVKRCNEVMQGKTEEVIYTNENGQPFYQSPNVSTADPDIHMMISAINQSSGSFKYKNSDGTRMIVFSKSKEWGNILYKIIPLEVIYLQASITRNISWMISLGILIGLIIATAIISSNFTRPLAKLEMHMESAGKGDFTTILPIKGQDEISKMSEAFNLMVSNIRNLIDEKYNIQLTQRTSQLKALQAQINPHFMNNTLQAIGSKSLDCGMENVYEMTLALSKMLRYSIKAGGTLVTVKDEINNINDYLFIQKSRFEDKLEYSIDIPEDLYNIKIPKLLFQPIVENAINHGIEPKKEKGTVMIQCRENLGSLDIIIQDDGVGMPFEDLAALREELKQVFEGKETESDSLGIQNVAQRLRLVLGNECSLSVESLIDQGTTINIRVPIILQ